MSKGICFLAEEHPGAFPAHELIESFAGVGIYLANPWNGLITELNDEGDQAVVSELELETSLQSKTVATFQFWFSDSVDLTCSFRRLHADGLGPFIAV